MKILVVNNMAPFVRGGAELLATQLVKQLCRAGHDAQLLRIPFRWEPAERIYDEMLACRMMQLWNVDRVIALKFPAYLVPHPRKTLWLLHQYRQAYDLWDAGASNLKRDGTGDRLRNSIRAADDQCFRMADRIYVNSRVTQHRLRHYNGFTGQVLVPPLLDAERFRGESCGDYIFCGGRVNDAKRQYLLIEAMRHVRRPVKLVIAGPPDQPQDARRLEVLVQRLRLQDRVHLDLRYVPRDELARYVNRSLACAYLPYDEDSYGYVAMEACQAQKPVLTLEDSGGVLDLVRHRQTGLVAASTPEDLARALDELCQDPAQTRQWGQAAFAWWQEQDITWTSTIRKLVA